MDDHWRSWDDNNRWHDDTQRRDEDFRRNNDPTNPASPSYWGGVDKLNGPKVEMPEGGALIDSDKHPWLARTFILGFVLALLTFFGFLLG